MFEGRNYYWAEEGRAYSLRAEVFTLQEEPEKSVIPRQKAKALYYQHCPVQSQVTKDPQVADFAAHVHIWGR